MRGNPAASIRRRGRGWQGERAARVAGLGRRLFASPPQEMIMASGQTDRQGSAFDRAATQPSRAEEGLRDRRQFAPDFGGLGWISLAEESRIWYND